MSPAKLWLNLPSVYGTWASSLGRPDERIEGHCQGVPVWHISSQGGAGSERRAALRAVFDEDRH